mgnify:CR=1 FL=1
MEKIYTAIPTSTNIQPKKENIDKIKAFAASYRVKQLDQQIIFEGFFGTPKQRGAPESPCCALTMAQKKGK